MTPLGTIILAIIVIGSFWEIVFAAIWAFLGKERRAERFFTAFFMSMTADLIISLPTRLNEAFLPFVCPSGSGCSFFKAINSVISSDGIVLIITISTGVILTAVASSRNFFRKTFSGGLN